MKRRRVSVCIAFPSIEVFDWAPLEKGNSRDLAASQYDLFYLFLDFKNKVCCILRRRDYSKINSPLT